MPQILVKLAQLNVKIAIQLNNVLVVMMVIFYKRKKEKEDINALNATINVKLVNVIKINALHVLKGIN